MDSDRIDADEITGWAISAQTGDPIAAAAFIRATQAEVWRFVAALVDPGAADDLTQETYLRAFRALPSFEARATARTWLARDRPPYLRRSSPYGRPRPATDGPNGHDPAPR